MWGISFCLYECDDGVTLKTKIALAFNTDTCLLCVPLLCSAKTAEELEANHTELTGSCYWSLY